MSRLYVFADEAGCFTFTRQNNVSRYFILCTVAMKSCDVGTDLMNLRRELAWAKAELRDYFHATDDKQAVRDAVYATILKHEFYVQATIMEKPKAQPQVCMSKPTFYQYGWYYHFKFGMPQHMMLETESLISAASLGTNKERQAFHSAIQGVMRQTIKGVTWNTDFLPAGSDPCLQVADYCAWAIQKKWERGDVRSYDLIKDRITYEYDLWQKGTKTYY
jgi:hypothetical protein